MNGLSFFWKFHDEQVLKFLGKSRHPRLHIFCQVACFKRGETKEMLSDLLFKATGLEKVVYYSASFVLLRRCWLETGESLLGTGTFKNTALLETAIVKATGTPFARVDFNVIGNHWIKRVSFIFG